MNGDKIVNSDDDIYDKKWLQQKERKNLELNQRPI